MGEHFKNKTGIGAGHGRESELPQNRRVQPKKWTFFSSLTGLRPLRDGYGRAILHAGLYAQLRSRPTMHHSTPQLAPIMPASSAME